MTREAVSANRRREPSPAGLTILELMTALFICSLLFIFLITAYGSFLKISNFQKSSTDLENQFMLITQVIEKDVRLAGFNLPGNGLYVKNAGAPDFYFVALSNEAGARTTLASDAQNGDPNVKVTTASATAANQWVSLRQGSTIALYQICRVGLCTGSDTIVLADSTCHRVWSKDSTQVYFAKGARYGIETRSGKRCLVRTSLTASSQIGSSIDTLLASPKDISGADLGANYSQAKILGITLGGKVGPAGKVIRVMKSFDVELRNSQ